MQLAGIVRICDYLQNVILQKHDSIVSVYSAYGEDILLILNPHVKPGLRYKLSDENVLEVYVDGLFKDRLTIVFNNPPQRLELYNNTILLERFGELVIQLCKLFGSLPRINPPGLRRDFGNFNGSLQYLTILKLHQTAMDYLPLSFANLHSIVHLELVHCGLIEIPVFVGDYPNLSLLILAHNKLCAQLNWDFLTRPCIREKLFLLDLQFNELRNVPNELVNLNQLTICRMDDNLLTTLPTSLKSMEGLRILTVSRNKIRIYPYNVLPLDTFALDVAYNPFTSRYFVMQNNSPHHEVPSLKELAARVMVDHRLPVQMSSVPRFVPDYLKKAQFCAICSGAYFDVFIACFYIPIYRLYTEVLTENGHLNDGSVIVNLCSRQCMQMNPELRFCEVLSHLTPEEYNDLVRHLC